MSIAWLLILGVQACAQSVFPTLSGPSATSSVFTSGNGGASKLESTLGVLAPSSLLGWAGLSLHPALAYTLTYSEGVQSEPGHPSNTYVETVAPALLLNAGKHWALDYAPTWSYYSNRAFQNTPDQSIVLTGADSAQDWTMGFSQSYSLSSPTLIETGSQTRQESFATSLNSSYQWGSQVQITVSGSQNVQKTGGLSSSREWTNTDALHYIYSSRVEAAMTVTVGYVDVSKAADMFYINPQVRLSLKPTDKLVFTGATGFENRQFISGGAPAMKNLTLSSTASYQPFEHTSLDLTLSRAVTPSSFAQDVTINNSWSISVGQRLLQHFQLAAGIAGQSSHYVATQNIVTGNTTVVDAVDESGNPGQLTTTTYTSSSVFSRREDSQRSLFVRLSTTLLHHCTVALSYQHSSNSSNVGGFGFASSQMSCAIGCSY